MYGSMSLAWYSNWHEFCQTLSIQHEKCTLLVTKLPEVILSLQLEAFKKQLMKSLSEDSLLQLSETGLEHDAEDNLTTRPPS